MTPYIIKWLSDNHGAIVPIIIAIYWVLSALKGAMTPPKPPVLPTPKVAPTPPTLAGPQPQRLPYQPLAGAVTQNPPAPARPAFAAPPAAQTQTFAEQAVTRLEQRFASNLGNPAGPGPATQSSQSMSKLRAESDRQFTSDAATSTAQQIATDKSAAASAANRPGLIEVLGDGSSRKGSLVAALILSQALARRRPAPRSGGYSRENR